MATVYLSDNTYVIDATDEVAYVLLVLSLRLHRSTQTILATAYIVSATRNIERSYKMRNCVRANMTKGKSSESVQWTC